MPFGLCNAPTTFQRCIMAIFHELIEDNMEVYMDDFSVFGSSFDHCLANMEKILKRCKETNRVLNREKCHFMVREGIVLGHKVFGQGIEVDKAKIKSISKLPYLTNVKAVHIFLGHAVLPFRSTRQEKQKFFSDLRHFFWDEPFLFKQCAEQIIRRCVSGNEAAQILQQFHSCPSGGHHGIATTARKVFEAEFYWPNIFRNAQKLVQSCEACQRDGNIFARGETS
ncbi:reverse transcriptase domain-containing protein [Tanacetum coccineum]